MDKSKLTAKVLTKMAGAKTAAPTKEVLVDLFDISGEPDEVAEAVDAIDVSGNGSFKNPWKAKGWEGYKDFETAERAAFELVADRLDSDPNSFDKAWLSKFLTMTDVDRRVLAADNTDREMRDLTEAELLKRSGLSDDMADLEKQLEAEKITGSEFDEKAEDLVDRARDFVENDIYDTWYDGLTDPVKFLVDVHGAYELDTLMTQSFIYVDEEAAAWDYVYDQGPKSELGVERQIDGTYWYQD